MNNSKSLTQLVGLIIILGLLAGCASAPTQPAVSPTTPPSPVPEPTATLETGSISGRVHLVSPPTPAMIVYAVDQETGLWSVTETAATDGEALFTLTVPPGTYQVYAFSVDSAFAGYSEDGLTLTGISVAAGQTAAEIIVRPPSQSECGATFGVPAAPDGRFAAVAGPDPACLTSQGEVLPATTPIGFEFLYGLGSVFMLPPQFPVAEGLPAVVPFVLSVDAGDYDIGLDYGVECQGAGACHYGSLSGKKVESDQPQSTTNFVFEAERAQPVTLAKNIQGYFVEGLCGASCDDSKLFWIYNGFQFMIGLKGAGQQDLIDLANAAIENSLH